MLDLAFARRLFRWATRGFFVAIGVLLLGVLVAYGLGERSSFAMEVAGHWFIAVGALGIKLSYLARLAARDVLRPDPDGWIRETPPNDLPRLGLVLVQAPAKREELQPSEPPRRSA